MSIESYIDYRESIDTIVDVIIDEYEHDPSMNVHDSIHEHVDASRLCFIIPEAIKVLQYSDSEPNGDLWPQSETWSEAICAMSFECVRQDTIDELHRRDVDLP